MRARIQRYAWEIGIFAAVSCSALYAQDLPGVLAIHEGGPVPVLTGFMSYQSNFGKRTFDMNPDFAPVVLLPLGKRTLVQAEFDMSLDEMRDTGRWGPAVVAHGFDYLQADLFVHPNLTVVAGRYLVPFGIYRERMHPLWIRYLQNEPISFTLNATSGNGAMVRGGAHVSESADVTYSAYYSAATTNNVVQSDRQAGFRGSLVLLNQRLEIGSSYNRTRGDGAHTMFGTDLTWLPKKIPLEVRSETLFSKEAGNTYWVEGAYRLKGLSSKFPFKYTTAVFRQEQFWLPANAVVGPMPSGLMGSLPDTTTTRSTAGLDYLLTPNLRLNAAYQGNFATDEHGHLWNAGLTYRFTLP